MAAELTLSPAVSIGLLVGLAAVVALAYLALVPYGQGPDEESHGLFVATLAGRESAAGGWAWGLPKLGTDPGDQNFEVHQPPLYYLLAAVGYRWVGLWPARLLSLLASLMLVWVVWRLVREVAGEDLALASAAVVALLPMQAFLATRVTNDPLVNLLWAIALWRWTITFRDGPSRREGLWAGLAVGAALLTKANSLGLLPLTFVALLLSGLRHRRWSAAMEQAAITLAVAGVIAGWWYVRNRLVYGDFLAQTVFDERFLAHRMTRDRLAVQFAHRPEWSYWPYVGEWIARTSVIYIGMGFLRLPAAIYPTQLSLIALAAIGGVAALGQRWRRGFDAAAATSLLLAVGMALVAAMLVRFNLVYFQAQGRYLFLLLPGWALLLTAGWSRPFPPGSRLRSYGLLVMPLWFALVDLLLLGVFLPGLFEELP